jgi:hypothetical protein
VGVLSGVEGMASGVTKGVMINDSASSFDAAAISVSLTAFIVAYFVLLHYQPHHHYHRRESAL